MRDEAHDQGIHSGAEANETVSACFAEHSCDRVCATHVKALHHEEQTIQPVHFRRTQLEARHRLVHPSQDFQTFDSDSETESEESECQVMQCCMQMERDATVCTPAKTWGLLLD